MQQVDPSCSLSAGSNKTNTTKTTNSQFRTILQNIVCKRYADNNAAYRAIDEAFQADKISQIESRKLEAAVG